MFDIVKCPAHPKAHGFERLYSLDEAKGRIASFENVTAAAESRNKKILAILGDTKFDEGAIKLIAEKKKLCILFDLSRIINSRGMRRAVELSKMRSFLRICNRHGAFYAFASFAEKEDELRSADELMHIAMLTDINKGQAKFALQMLKEYLG